MFKFNHNDLHPEMQLDATTLYNWLFTRKKENTIGGLPIRGLFSTQNPVVDFLAMMVIIILEMYGLYMYYDQSTELLVLLGFFIADFVFAIGLHLQQREWLIAKYRIIFYANDSITGILNLNKIKKINLIRNAFKFLILLIAAFKVIGYYSFKQEFDGIVLSVILSYLLVGFLHIKNTGNFMFYFYYSFIYNRIYNQFLKEQSHRKTKTEYLFITDASLPSLITSDNHKIVKLEFTNIDTQNKRVEFIENGNILFYQPTDEDEIAVFQNSNINLHKLVVYGNLLDYHLMNLSNSALGGNASIEVAKHCIKTQFKQMGIPIF